MNHARRLRLLGCALMALTVLIGLTVPAASEALKDYENRKKLARINADLEKWTTRLKALEQEMEDVSVFSQHARQWFLRMRRVEAKIKAAKSNDLATFDRSQQKSSLDKLYNERDRIMNMEGGASISGKSYSSLSQLRKDFITLGMHGKDLRAEYKKVGSRINALRDKRENLWDHIVDVTEADARELGKEIRSMRETLDFILTMLADPNVWVIEKINTNGAEGIPFIHEDDALWNKVTWYGEHVASEITDWEALGKVGPKPRFEAERLAAYLKHSRDQSNQAKSYIHENIVPNLKREIAARVARLEKMERELAAEELAGCWFLIMKSNKRPTIDVRKKDDVYYGSIADNTGLRHFERGHLLFTVSRENHRTFTGMENTFRKDGAAFSQPVRIDVDKGGSGLTYRSTSNYRMHRCQ